MRCPVKVIPSASMLDVGRAGRDHDVESDMAAFDIVLHEVEKARGGDHKSVVIVPGEPGSGKSVIALSLLGELGRRGGTAVHATGSRSFTQTLRKVTSRNAPRVRSLFMYFNSFMDAERNGLDVLIADEAPPP